MNTIALDDTQHMYPLLEMASIQLFHHQMPLAQWLTSDPTNGSFQARLTPISEGVGQLHVIAQSLTLPGGAHVFADTAKDVESVYVGAIATRIADLHMVEGRIPPDAFAWLRSFISYGRTANAYGESTGRPFIDLENSRYSLDQFLLLWRVGHRENGRPYLLPPQHFADWLTQPDRQHAMSDVLCYLHQRTSLEWSYGSDNTLFVTLDGQPHILELNAPETAFIRTDTPNRHPESALALWQAALDDHDYQRMLQRNEARDLAWITKLLTAITYAQEHGSFGFPYIADCYRCGHFVLHVPSGHIALCETCALRIAAGV